MVQYRDRCVINNLAMGETTYTYKPVRSVTFHLSILSGEMEVTKGALLRRLPDTPSTAIRNGNPSEPDVSNYP